ncbi:MAG: LacI family DNA-binding transcriptional regulator [Pseudomonadota bacterium]
MKKKSAKLSDVARLAGVSTATVSRALSLPQKVRPETLEKIQRVIKKLGYVPHGAARALALRRTFTIGAVVPTLDNAIFAETTHALQKTLDEAGYTLLLACHEFNPDVETRVARTLIERGVDGVVLFGTDHQKPLWQLIETLQLPYVLSWAFDKTGARPCVGFDSRAAGRRVAEYLIDLGHRRFAMISGLTATNERHRARVQGVKDALAARGIPLEPACVVEKQFSPNAGREAMHELLKMKVPPTAVICGNDVLAIGAIAECHAAGLEVPGDLSITGFDDMAIASMISPGLTTVRFPAYELGKLAAENLLLHLNAAGAPAQRELPVELIVRESTAPPRQTLVKVS